MDAAEVRLNTLETEMDAAEVRLTTGETSATDHGSRITVLENAGGGSVDPHRVEFEANNQNYPLISADTTEIVYTRNGGSSDGGVMTYTLPATADVEHGHTINVHCFNQVGGSTNGGTVYFKLNDIQNQAFGSNSFASDRVHSFNSEKCYINNIHRSTFSLHLNKTAGVAIATWYIRCVADSHAIYTNESDIAALQTAMDDVEEVAGNVRGFKYFGDAHTAHGVSTSSAYQIPSGFQKYEVVYGSGLIDANSHGHLTAYE